MLKKRVVTAAVIGLPALALIAFGPNWAVLALITVAIGLATWEWGELTGLHTAWERALLVALVVAPLVALGVTLAQPLHLLVLLFAVLWWLLIVLALPFYQSGVGGRGPRPKLLTVAAVLTLVPAGLAMVWLHALVPWLVVYLIVLVGFADTGAYFAGKAFGRNPLAPQISPGKTREGLLGGLIAVFALSVVVAGIWGLPPMDALVFVLLSLLIALVSVVGDLFESILKRQAGAKDSGSLLPGHGGILDRIDSLIAAAPIFLAGLLWLALLPVPGPKA